MRDTRLKLGAIPFKTSILSDHGQMEKYMSVHLILTEDNSRGNADG